MNTPTVVITETLDAGCADWLAGQATVVWCRYDQPDPLAAHLSQAQGLIVRTYTQVNASLLDLAPQLRVVGRAGVGLENIDLRACQDRGVQVVYTPEANTHAVVEYTLALILDQVRPRVTLTSGVDGQAFHALRQQHIGTQLAGRTLGILGLGRIGKRLGAAAHALGINLLVNDLLPASTLRQAVTYPFQWVEKPQLYAGCDILSIHADARPENHHLIDADALSQLKPNCLLINTARGSVIDTAALADWARAVADQGGQAVLDVHDPEPPPPDYPLYGLPNVRLMPHLASRTTQAMQNMSWVVRDVAAVLRGHPPQYPAY